MKLLEAIGRRRTTNGPLRADPVKIEHEQLLVDAAGRVPSHFNSQPWRLFHRHRIDRNSDQRKRLSQLVYRNACRQPWPGEAIN